MVAAESSLEGRRPPRRRWLARLLRAGAALLALLVLALALRGWWLTPLLVTRLQQEVRTRFGAELEVGGVTLGLDHMVVEGIVWRGSQAPLLRLEDGRIELRFSLRDLLGERADWISSLAVQARAIELDLDVESESSDGAAALPTLPRLELDLADVLVRGRGFAPVHLDRLSARAGLDPRGIALASLEVSAGANQLRARDARIEPGAGGLEDVARRSSGDFTLSLLDPTSLAPLAGLPLSPRSAELTLSVRSGRAQISGQLELASGAVSIERGVLTLPEGAPLADLQLELALSAELRDLSPLGALLGQELAGSWRGAIEVRGPLHAPVGHFRGSGTGIAAAGLTLDTLVVDLETDGQRARIESCHATGPGFVTEARGELGLHPLELRDLSLTTDAKGSALTGLLPFPCDEVFLHARLSGSPQDPTGEFEASMTGAELGRLRLDDAAARGTIAGGALEISELRLTNAGDTLRASGRLRRQEGGFGAELETLEIEWRGVRGVLARPASVHFGPGRVAVAGLEFASGARGAPGEEPGPAAGRARITVEHADGATRAELEFVDFAAGPLVAAWLPEHWSAGLVNGRLSGSLGAGAPELQMELGLAHWVLGAGQPELALDCAGRLAAGRLTLERLRVATADGASVLSGSLDLPFDWENPTPFAPGAVALRLELLASGGLQALEPFALPVALPRSGPAHLRAELGGSWSALTGGLRAELADLALQGGKDVKSCDIEGELQLGERLHLAGLTFSAPGNSVRLRGDVALAADLPLLLRDPHALLSAPLALEAELALGDIAWLAQVFPELRRISGAVAGSVPVRGTLVAPELGGALTWRGGELRLVASATALRNAAADLHFEKDVVVIDSLTGEFGGAPVEIKGTLEPFGPFPRMDLALAGKNLLLARSARLRLRADADLAIKGTPSQLHVGGELALTEGRYTGEFDPLKEIVHVGRGGGGGGKLGGTVALWRSGLLASTTLDVHVGGGRLFEYGSNVLEATLRPDFWLRGTGAALNAEGRVFLDRASLKLPSGTMDFAAGLLELRPEEPFRPNVTLSGEQHLQGYDVRISMTGWIDDPQIDLSSNPSLATDDLWILMLTGQLPTDRWQDRGQQAMESLALFLARDQVVRWFSDDAAGLFDRFEIDVGAKTTQSGQPTGRVLFYLKPRKAGSGRATYLSAEIDEHDRVNYALGIVFRPR